MSMETRDPEWMTMEEVAFALGVSLATVRAWTKRGYVPAATERAEWGRLRVRMRRSDVRAFAEVHYMGKPRPPWLDEPWNASGGS